MCGECCAQILVTRQTLDDRDDVGVLKEHEATISVVVRKRAEGFGPQRDLRVQFTSRLERDAHVELRTISRRRTCRR